MLSRCWSMLAICLVFVLSTGVEAKEGGITATKMGDSTIERTVQLRTHSLHPPYIDQDLQNRWWDFGADAYVNTNKHVRLTQHKASQTGWLWSRLALTATNWVIETEFKVGGETSHLYGDGMAMWITTERAQPGPIFGNQDNFNGFAIVLDTYSNGKHNYGFPRILGVRLDGKTKYDYGNDGDSQSLGSCAVNFRRANVATKLRVTYVKGQFLDVKVQFKAWDEWTDCFFLPQVSLPENPFIGFSAMTGEVSDAHDIISVTTYSAILSPPDAPKDQYKPKNKWGLGVGSSSSDTVQPGTWLGLLFKVFLLAGVCAGAWYGYQEYLRRQRLGGFGGYDNAPSSARSFMGPNSAASAYSSYTPTTGGFGGQQPPPNSAYSNVTGGAYTPSTAGFTGGLAPNSAYSAPPTGGFGRPSSPYSPGLPSAGPPSAASSYARPGSANSYNYESKRH